jgi:hypothetical protein
VFQIIFIPSLVEQSLDAVYDVVLADGSLFSCNIYRVSEREEKRCGCTMQAGKWCD